MNFYRIEQFLYKFTERKEIFFSKKFKKIWHRNLFTVLLFVICLASTMAEFCGGWYETLKCATEPDTPRSTLGCGPYDCSSGASFLWTLLTREYIDVNSPHGTRIFAAHTL